MWKIKIYLLDTSVEIIGNSKPVLGAVMHPLYLMEMLSAVTFLVELYAIESPTFHLLIGEYNSIREFTKEFEKTSENWKEVTNG
jgi:hypothetical protein